MNSKDIISHRLIIAMSCLEGFGPVTVRKICDCFNKERVCPNTPEELWDSFSSLISLGIGGKKIRETHKSSIYFAFQQAETILRKNEEMGIKCVSIYDDTFPNQLHQTKDENGKSSAPILLYYKGNLRAANLPGVAIIGTREPTQEGIIAGKFFGEYFGSRAFNIVSGLALGCDTAGHMGALNANGTTTALLAHGLDTIFPPQNKVLAENIVLNGGLLMSEYPIGMTVSMASLIDRDRLQAGLSRATIVIQTGKNGGTMHAAKATIASNKPLFVVQYQDMTHPKVEGNIYLTYNGARYISSGNVEGIYKKLKEETPEEPFKDTLF